MPDQISGLLSPLLRDRRLRVAVPFIRHGRVLDMGCGIGELARWVESHRYLGVDSDEESLSLARTNHPAHEFLMLAAFEKRMPPAEHGNQPMETFGTIVALAVIEHLPDPGMWLAGLKRLLAPAGRIIITTPHPTYRRAHEVGAALGLFSREAAAEHHTLLDAKAISELASRCGLHVIHAKRFLAGANQLFVLANQFVREPCGDSG